MCHHDSEEDMHKSIKDWLRAQITMQINRFLTIQNAAEDASEEIDAISDDIY